MSEQLTYRLFEDTDIPGLLRLWQENTDWGELTEETWRSWYMDTPYGPCLVAVAATDDGDIAAQLVFTPSRVVVSGRTVNALRLSAPILRQDLRKSTAPMLRRTSNDDSNSLLEHPVVRIYFVALEAAARAGYGLVYALPQYSWLTLFRWANSRGIGQFSVAEWPCVATPVFAATSDLLEEMPHLTARRVAGFADDYEDLWRLALDALPTACAVARHPQWLRWRKGDNTVIEVRDTRDGSLVGFAAVKENGLLFDMLARSPDDLKPVIRATLDVLRSNPSGSPEMLQVMQTPVLEPVLTDLGFSPVDYRFAFMCLPLDPSLPPAAADPGQWYVMPGD